MQAYAMAGHLDLCSSGPEFQSKKVDEAADRRGDVLTSTITARLARTPSIVDDGRIHPTVVDDLQGE